MRPMTMRHFASSLLAAGSMLLAACGGAATQDASTDNLTPEDERLARVYAAVLPLLAAVEGGPKKQVYALTTTVPTGSKERPGRLEEDVRERAEELSGLDVEWVPRPEDAYEPGSSGLVKDGTSLLTLGTVGTGDDVRVLGVNYVANLASRSPLMRVVKEANGDWTATVENGGPIS